MRRTGLLFTLVCSIFAAGYGVEKTDADFRVIKLVESSIQPDNKQRIGASVVKPSINHQGDIAFAINGSDQAGVWLASADGKVQRIVEADVKLPTNMDGSETVSANKIQWLAVAMNSSRQMILSSYHGLYSFDPNLGLELIAVPNMTMPTDSTKRLKLAMRSLNIDEAGTCIFSAQVYAQKETEDEDTDPIQQLFRRHDEDAEASALYRKKMGEPLELLETSTNDRNQRNYEFAVNLQGDMVFQPGSIVNKPLKLLMDGSLVPIMRFEDPMQLEERRTCLVRGVGRFGINNERKSVMTARVLDQSSGKIVSAYFSHQPNIGWKNLLCEGMSFPEYAEPSVEGNVWPCVNRHGNVLFVPHAVGSKSNPTVIYIDSQNVPRVIAAAGKIAPGTTDFFAGISNRGRESFQELFGNGVRPELLNRDSPFSDGVLNARNQIAFVGSIAQSSDSRKLRLGIWVSQPDAKDLKPLVMVGQELEVAPNDVRTIQYLSFAGESGNEDGRASGMNELGQITFVAGFTDRSVAVVQSNVVAGEPLQVAKRDESSQAPLTADEEAEVAKWEKAADVQIQAAQKRLEQSDMIKLTKLANDLRTGYASTAERLRELLKGSTQSDAIEQYHQIQTQRKALTDYKKIWNALANRPFFAPKARSSEEDRKFSDDSVALLAKYRDRGNVKDRIEAKLNKLKELAVPEFEFVENKNDERFPLGFGNDNKTLKQFAGSIGPDFPELMLQQQMGPTDLIHSPPSDLFRTVHGSMQRIVRLEFNSNGKLDLNRRHWLDDSQPMGDVESRKKAEDMLTERGVSETVLFSEHDLRMPKQFRDSQLGFNQSPAISLFTQLHSVIGRGGSSAGGGGNEYHYDFHTDTVFGSMRVSDISFMCRLQDVPNHWQFEIRADNSGFLKVEVTGPRSYWMLLQLADGGVRWLETETGGRTVIRNAASFAELYRLESNFVETEIIDRLNSMGILGPATRNSDNFIDLLTKRLEGRESGVADRVQMLAKQLDSGQFDVRNDAFHQLAARAHVYEDQLQLVVEQNLSVEAKLQIRKILKYCNETGGEHRTLMDALKVTDSPAQLVHLMKNAKPSVQSKIGTRLAELTSQDFGGDADAWAAWMNERSQ
ncbi:MAG: hypothetical protein KDA87_16780 [Planctomycetales bacterium]|nr:hypothetical protein [Planctomycetales bacterium]